MKKELKYLREIGVYEKVDERTAVANYNVTPIDLKWVTPDKPFEEEPMQISSRIVARGFKKRRQAKTCMRGLSHWKL